MKKYILPIALMLLMAPMISYSFQGASIFTLVVTDCDDDFTVACCCDDGNQYVGTVKGNTIVCYAGGYFECLGEYSDCWHPEQTKCDQICPGLGCA
jgi:hypothetical protein